MSSQPDPVPSDATPASQLTKPLRELVALVLLGANALLLLAGLLSLVAVSWEAATFFNTADNAFYTFAGVQSAVLPLLAVLLTTHVQPVPGRAKLITVLALAEYAFAALLGVITLVGWLIAGAVGDQNPDYFTATYWITGFLSRLAYLAIFAVSAVLVFRVWSRLFHVAKPKLPPGVYGQPAAYGQGAYPPAYGQQAGHPAGYPHGYGQRAGAGYGGYGQPAGYGHAGTSGQVTVPIQAGEPQPANPASGQPAYQPQPTASAEPPQTGAINPTLPFQPTGQTTHAASSNTMPLPLARPSAAAASASTFPSTDSSPPASGPPSPVVGSGAGSGAVISAPPSPTDPPAGPFPPIPASVPRPPTTYQAPPADGGAGG